MGWTFAHRCYSSWSCSIKIRLFDQWSALHFKFAFVCSLLSRCFTFFFDGIVLVYAIQNSSPSHSRIQAASHLFKSPSLDFKILYFSLPLFPGLQSSATCFLSSFLRQRTIFLFLQRQPKTWILLQCHPHVSPLQHAFFSTRFSPFLLLW